MAARFPDWSEDQGQVMPEDQARLGWSEWHCPGRVSAWREEQLPRFQIEFMLEGMDLRRLAGARPRVIDPSQVFLLAAGEGFELASPTAQRRRSRCLQLPAPLLQAWAPDLVSGLLPSSPELALAVHALGAAPDALARDEAGWRVLALILRLQRPAAAERAPARRSQRRQEDLVEALRERMAMDFAQPLSLESLARACGASAFHAARVFRQHTGQSIHGHLQRLRLRAALAQLPERRGQLTELALDCGFASHSHFSSSFRREFGRVPSSLQPA
ncbi:hypothetical protein C1O66_16805 [Paucibacter aquatile]|uniref:HTH araC/xylS-type domain-containing protein n=1 Tax=Kinneretia aquatilis TaxID=2070761 RepID=A0A2N8L036_9BURK|nr:AraC family transcriptional regulator [Paucibacter aquatile]PND39022.1 hypothetical protein C1O66_16805 [Paucibacter aquatile]